MKAFEPNVDKGVRIHRVREEGMASPGRRTCMCRHRALDIFRDRQEIKYRWNGEEERFFLLP